MSSASLLLHPVRLRIIKAFVGERLLTTSQVAAEVPDVPEATVYRNVARLWHAGVLEVVSECRVRGAVERTYGLRPSAARIAPEEAAAMTVDDHIRAFLAYVAGMLADLDRYLETAPDPVLDGASYQVAGMWLTDTEFAAFARDLATTAGPRLANQPGPGRRRRLLYTVVLPSPGSPEGRLPPGDS